jgi:pimeloyl-ACP methyl ester carboxylesterase
LNFHRAAAMIYPHFDHGKPEAAVRWRMLKNGNGLDMHVLEAGFESENRPCVLLLHGFPELAYSWRKVLPAIAAAGFHVVAPDQRGYGRTTGWDQRYDGDLASFHLLNLVKDTVGLVSALGVSSVASVIGHDFGSPVAAWCALLHPDLFRSAALLSAPFGGAPRPPPSGAPAPPADLAKSLAALHPPRKHYQWYFSTRAADADMRDCPQGIHAFLRAYFHIKSADWDQNNPHPLGSWAPDELAKMPRYYVMDLGRDMAETVAEHAPDADATKCAWLPDHELRVYSEEFARTSFQGGLQWYRNLTDAQGVAKLQAFFGRSIDVPCCFIAGKRDWGVYQSPGALQAMQSFACTQFRGAHLVDGAGHWVQQEQPAAVSELLINFLMREL